MSDQPWTSHGLEVLQACWKVWESEGQRSWLEEFQKPEVQGWKKPEVQPPSLGNVEGMDVWKTLPSTQVCHMQKDLRQIPGYSCLIFWIPHRSVSLTHCDTKLRLAGRFREQVLELEFPPLPEKEDWRAGVNFNYCKRLPGPGYESGKPVLSWSLSLEQNSPLEFSKAMKMVNICTVQYGNYSAAHPSGMGAAEAKIF